MHKKTYTPLSLEIRKKRTFQIIFVSTIFLLQTAVVLYAIMQKIAPKPQIQPASVIFPLLKSTIEITSDESPPSHMRATMTLDERIGERLAATQGTYSIVIKNLHTQELYQKNSQKLSDAASLYKLWIMAQTYQDIYDGKLQLTDKLSQPIEALNSYFAIATDSARLSQGVVTYTVREALEEMITNSHDYASLLLAQRVGTPRMREFLRRHRFDHSTLDSPPQTTASDIAAFFEKLYLGELASSAHTHEMLTLLELQNLNYGIPKYLPNTIRILHKTGTLGSVSHDAGIVYSPEGGEDYIIVILTNTPDTREAENTIALLSRDVYDYFRAKNKR